MEPFAIPLVGELALASMTKPLFRELMRRQGIAHRSATTSAELDAHFELLKGTDRGQAFLRIMRGFERTAAKRRLYESTVRDVPYPVQALWGALDPGLTLEREGEQVRRAARLEVLDTVPAKHFLQEDQAPAIADRVAALVARS